MSNYYQNLFRDAYNDQVNILTPRIERFGRAGHYAYELSSGEPPSFNPCSRTYGVTVLQLSPKGFKELYFEGRHYIKRRDLTRCFADRASAERYIKTVRRQPLKLSD